MSRHRVGRLVTFATIVIVTFVAVDYYTGYDVVGAAARFLWNGLVFLVNSLVRLFGGLAGAFARNVGLRRLARLATALTSVGLGYAGSVILSDARLRKAHGWRGKIKIAITLARNWWLQLHVAWKIVIVACLIASQAYLHFLLIVFPIAFLVPFVRRAWTLAADGLFGGWYWRRFGRAHRAAVARLKTLPGCRHVIGAVRLARLRYLCAWRLWKYDPRYRLPGANAHVVSLAEPIRLWWRGDLDRYIGRPLLAGSAGGSIGARDASMHGRSTTSPTG